MLRGSDQKYKLYITVDGDRINLIEDITYLKIELYDKRDVLIEAFKYPDEDGYTPLEIVTDVDYADRVFEKTGEVVSSDTAMINVDGANTLNARKGALYMIRTYGVSDAGFNDGSYDKSDKILNFDTLTNV